MYIFVILVLHVDAYCVSHLRSSTIFTSAFSPNLTLPLATCVSLSELLFYCHPVLFLVGLPGFHIVRCFGLNPFCFGSCPFCYVETSAGWLSWQFSPSFGSVHDRNVEFGGSNCLYDDCFFKTVNTSQEALYILIMSSEFSSCVLSQLTACWPGNVQHRGIWIDLFLLYLQHTFSC